MSYATRWMIPFQSRAGVDCVINICCEGWDGEPTTLIGGAVPFELEEDNDDNMLNVFRIKTGYIRVIEENFGDLDKIYPEHPTDRYVDVYYGTHEIFSGFIQMQAFENRYGAGAREIELPVVSMLGVVGNYEFAARNPENLTLGDVLYTILDNTEFYGLIIPYSTGMMKSSSFNSTIISPYKDRPNQSNIATYDNFFEPITYKDFLTGLCNHFGWMVHEEGRILVFSRFDYEYRYAFYHFSDLQVDLPYRYIDGSQLVDIDNYFTPADDDAKISTVLPLKKITKKNGGEVPEEVKVEWKCSKGFSSFSYTDFYCNFLVPMTGQIFGPKLLNTNTFPLTPGIIGTPYGYLGNPGVNLAYCYGNDDTTVGDPTPKEIRLLLTYSSQWAATEKIFSVQFANGVEKTDRLATYNIEGKVEMKWGAHIASLSTPNINRNLILAVSAEIDGVVTGYGKLTINGSGDEKGIGYFHIKSNVHVYGNKPITVHFNLPGSTTAPGFIENYVYSFEKISLVGVESYSSSYDFSTTDDWRKERIYKGSDGSSQEEEIDDLFSSYNQNTNYLDENHLTYPRLKYNYMSTPFTRLRIRTQINNLPENTSDLYLYKYSIEKLNPARLIACDVNPVDDEYILTLHESPQV